MTKASSQIDAAIALSCMSCWIRWGPSSAMILLPRQGIAKGARERRRRLAQRPAPVDRRELCAEPERPAWDSGAWESASWCESRRCAS